MDCRGNPLSEIILHPYQSDAKQSIYDSWNSGKRYPLLVSGTGSGKSVIMSDIVKDGFQAGMKQAVIAHRNELVTQMSMHIAQRGIPHRIIGSDGTVAQAQRKHYKKFGKSFIDPTASTSVVGVDTLMARRDKLTTWFPQVHRWLGDEWHHAVQGNKWGNAIELFTNARGVGVTATPQRADGKGLGAHADGYMDDIITGPSMRFLIDNRYLSEYAVVWPTNDLKRINQEKTSKNGDWSHKTMRKAVEDDGKRIVGNVVQNYIKYAYGRRAIVFATDIKTADEFAEEFNSLGIRAASVNGNSTTSYREQCIDQFESGEINVLINVDLFDEGFDVPACDVIVMARPTASLGKYLQMVGRALRFLPDKVALIIDHVGNIVRHGFPDKHRDWSLNRRDKRGSHKKDPEQIDLQRCNNVECGLPYEKFRTNCPYCGFEKPLPERKERSIEMVEGDLILLDPAALALMRQNTLLENATDISQRVAIAAGPIAGKAAANRQIEKILAQRELSEVIAQWAAVERLKGYNDREIHKRFYHTTGMDVISSLGSDNTAKQFREMKDRIKGWYE